MSEIGMNFIAVIISVLITCFVLFMFVCANSRPNIKKDIYSSYYNAIGINYGTDIKCYESSRMKTVEVISMKMTDKIGRRYKSLRLCLH